MEVLCIHTEIYYILYLHALGIVVCNVCNNAVKYNNIILRYMQDIPTIIIYVLLVKISCSVFTE